MGLPPAPRSPWRPTEDPAADIRFLRPGERGAQQQLAARGCCSATESSSCDDLWTLCQTKLLKVRKTFFLEGETDMPKRAWTRRGLRGGWNEGGVRLVLVVQRCAGLLERRAAVLPSCRPCKRSPMSPMRRCGVFNTVGRGATANGVSTLSSSGRSASHCNHCNLRTRKDSSADNIICRPRPRRCSAHTRRLTRAHSR